MDKLKFEQVINEIIYKINSTENDLNAISIVGSVGSGKTKVMSSLFTILKEKRLNVHYYSPAVSASLNEELPLDDNIISLSKDGILFIDESYYFDIESLIKDARKNNTLCIFSCQDERDLNSGIIPYIDIIYHL